MINHTSTRSWRSLKYIMALTVPLSVWISFQGEGAWTYTALIYTFIVLPVFELILVPNAANLSALQKEVVSKDYFYDALLWSLVAVQWGFLIYFIWSLSNGSWAFGSFEWWRLERPVKTSNKV